ncbi:MAG: HYR domain-containing protein, partial [Saprospiraceae bacterium]|nr:HYR domain-containing protein [Saprospiraceae bacterium]
SGCVELTYTLDNLGNCTISQGSIETYTTEFFVSQKLNPAFEAPTSITCWDGTSPETIDIINTGFSSDNLPSNASINWSIDDVNLNTSLVTSGNNAQVIINSLDDPSQTTGSVTICLEETISYTDALPVSDCIDSNLDCTAQTCKTLEIFKQNCNDDCLLYTDISQCPIESNPTFTFQMLGQNLPITPGIDVVIATVTSSVTEISCGVPGVDNIGWDYQLNLSWLDDVDGINDPIVPNIPLLGELCDIAAFSIDYPTGICDGCGGWCVDLGLVEPCITYDTWEPFNFLNFEIPGTDVSVCNATVKNMIIDPVQEIIEQTAIGVVWADTDGDGAFDYELSSGNLIFDGSASGMADVPNNVEGEGFIVIRNNTASVIAPYSPCVSPDEQSFFDLLPIDFIPIAGPVIRQALTTAGIDFNIALSAHKDLSIRVVNDQDPIFLNLPTEMVFHTNQFCDPVQWTDPIAIDGCTGAIIDNVTQTGGPSPGSILAVGSHIVEYTATACNDQSIVQEMEILIVEGTPDMVCPPNFSIRTDADNCSKIVTGITPLEGLGCNTVITWESVNQSGASQTGTGDASGTLFPLNDNTITYNLLHTDDNGQQSSASCTFTITVIDEEKPTAVCQDIEVQLNENGAALVSIDQINGGSFDNCTPSNLLNIQINRIGEPQTDVVSFSCEDKGNNTVALSVVDQASNERKCLSNVVVRDYFQDVIINFDAPEICLEANNPEQLDFNNYLTIGYPNGAITTAYDEFIDGDEIAGVFSIAGFLPSPGSASSDPGSINPVTGVFNPGEGTGFVTIAYVLGISNQVSVSSANLLEGCYVMVHETFELRQPLEMEEPECVCGDFTNRYVDLGIVEGGLEPYTIQYTGATLDLDEDFDTDDSDGSYTYSATDNHDITDFQQDLGQLKVEYNTPVWSITIVDARGCEIFRSGSCDNDDAGEAPSITCPADIGIVFTDEYVCTSFEEWLHPDILAGLLYDNCFIRQYNYYIENADGTVEGPFDLMPLVNIEDDGSTNVDPSLFEASHNFQKGVSTVFYYAADAVGNFIDCQFTVTVEDNLPPQFINCPYPPVVENSETDHCDAYVNFALPLAEDNCDVPTVTQIDNTGLTTGDRFPVGTTIMYWEAIDESDNRDTCQVKVIVNDYWNVPEIVCPEDVLQTTDDWRCDAEVYNIEPEISSVCQDNLSVFYEIFSDAALTNRISCGVWDASGEKFDKGDSWVKYTVESQPLLLISEISQSAALDQLEIVNLGPASMDLNCLEVVRTASNGTFTETLPMVTMLPSLAPTVLGVGEVMVFDFTADAPADMAACYLIQYMGSVIDQVAVNGYADACADFTGTLDSGDVYRHCEADTDAAADWVAAENCSPLTIGILNPDLNVMPDNGTLTSLQSEPASSASCVFQVTIIDDEDPFCGELATAPNNYVGPAINNISETTCNRSEIEILDGCIIGQFDFNLSGNVTPANATITLISPEGVEVEITTLPAAPFDYYTFKSEGIWTLDIEPNTGVTGLEVTAWTLDITCMLPFTMDDVLLPNDTDLCGAQFDWIHPWFVDNCIEGIISVEYITSNAECTPTNGQLIGFGGYDVSEFFCVGTTTVLYTLIDEAGNDYECSFDVTVEDVQDPVVVCPDDIIIQLNGGECRKLVCFEPLSATDNCAVVDTVYTVEPCTEFEIGITPVTITIFDEAGNSDECTFDIEIIEYVPDPYTMICNDLVNISLGSDCVEELHADMILEGNNYHCYEDYIITISDVSGPISTSPEVTINDVGNTYTVMVLDPDSGNSCWGEITIEDYNIPQLECPTDITISCLDPSDASFTGEAILTSCEASIEWITNDILLDFDNCEDVQSEITRIWTVVDESGNVNNCVQTIEIERIQLGDIEFPGNYDGITNPVINCIDAAANPAITSPLSTGTPRVGIYALNVGPNCGLAINVEDQEFFLCDGSYDIIRTWMVYDGCLPAVPGVNPIAYSQVIKVVDDSAPLLTCPDDMTISVDGDNNCKATFEVPAIGVADACSSYEVITNTPNGSIFGNGGLITNVPKGTFDIKYQVQDNCNNISACEFKLTIEDGVTPIMICQEQTDVVLTTDGTAIAYYESFDTGTYDNCCLDYFEVARMDDNIFGETIAFDCEDELVMVILKAFDCNGNMNQCMVEVTVEDKFNPTITCPANATIDCNVYNLDFAASLEYATTAMNDDPDLSAEDAFVFLSSSFGSVTSFDNCNVSTNLSVSYTVDQCGEGSIVRSWTATDNAGNTATPCSQTIFVEHTSDWTINFPENWSGELSPDCSVPEIGFGEAVVTDDNCEMIAVSFSDEVFNVTADACYKIVRSWTAINWCTYDVNVSAENGILISASDNVYNITGSDFISYIQILDIYDTLAPEVTEIDDITVGIIANCTVNVELPQPEVLNECSGYEVFVTSTDLAGFGSSFFYSNVVEGTYSVSYQIQDDCGNSSFETFNVIVKDEKAPTAFCTDQLVIELMPDGTGGGIAMVNAEDFNVGSFDNCTEVTDLVLSLSSNITQTTQEFDCSNVGIQPIELHVWDEAGNVDFCSVSLDIQDNNNICGLGSLTVTGTLITELDEAIESATIDINGGLFTSQTGLDGSFIFDQVLEGEDYSVVPSLDLDPDNGVTTFDIVLITRHILGIVALDSPYKIIAADVNNSGSVSTLDVVNIRKVILNIDPNFPNNTSWRFVDESYLFPDPANPWAPGFPEVVNFNNLGQDEDASFIGIKVGDVNGSAQSHSLMPAEEYDGEQSFMIKTDEQQLRKGQSYIVSLKANQPTLGFQFTLNFDNQKLSYEGMKDGLMTEENTGLTNLSYGAITCSWNDNTEQKLDDSELISFEFKALEDGLLSDLISINSRITRAEAYSNAYPLQDVNLMIGEALADNIELYQNVPNPFKGQTRVNFYLPEDSDATLTIRDLNGKIVSEFSSEFTQGNNTLLIKDIPRGVFYYTLEVDRYLISRKMVKL